MTKSIVEQTHPNVLETFAKLVFQRRPFDEFGEANMSMDMLLTYFNETKRAGVVNSLEDCSARLQRASRAESSPRLASSALPSRPDPLVPGASPFVRGFQPSAHTKIPHKHATDEKMPFALKTSIN